MLQVESAFVQNFDAARDGKTHDPRLQARGGSGIMDDTEVLAEVNQTDLALATEAAPAPRRTPAPTRRSACY
mgnify:CR=1 FL=1